MHPDFYNSDAFSLMTLTAVINNEENVPGRAGELVFAGIGEGVSTTSVDVEIDTKTLTLIPFSTRGGPGNTNGEDKRVLKSVAIPHIELTEGIQADRIQNVRELGSMDTLRGARSVVDKQMRKQSRRHDMTLEHLRLGALSGIVADKTGAVAVNLFTLFNVNEVTINFDSVFISKSSADSTLLNLQRKLMHLVEHMKRALTGSWTSSAKIWAFCGSQFFGKLVACIGATAVRGATADAKISLGDNYAHGVIEFGGVFFESYQGTNDSTPNAKGTVGIDPDECRFFVLGVPGLYEEYYAPGDFFEAVNTSGLPRYAKIAPNPDGLNRGVILHTQQNPLPICLKPRSLVKGVTTASTDDVEFVAEFT